MSRPGATRENSVAENLRVWDREYGWPEDGEEWQGQAIACGVPYADWKAALIERLIVPYAAPGSTVLEIAPGHGRWTEALAARAGRLILVDLSPSCIAFCQERFRDHAGLAPFVGDGRSLPPALRAEVDLVWSFDAFVHIGPADIAAYLVEMRRVLRPGGLAVIHHANRRHWTLPLHGMRQLGPRGATLYRYLSLGLDEVQDGWRSPVSARRFRSLAKAAGLEVVEQLSRWGDGDRYGVPRFRDRVSVLRNPA